jgi:hypothetical protein
LPVVWIQVSNTMPIAKKTLSEMPSPASVFSRLLRVSSSMNSAASEPVISAPARMKPRSRVPATMKPRQTPGSAACDSASPSRLCLRRTAKAPSTPEMMPSRAAPSATLRMV